MIDEKWVAAEVERIPALCKERTLSVSFHIDWVRRSCGTDFGLKREFVLSALGVLGDVAVESPYDAMRLLDALLKANDVWRDTERAIVSSSFELLPKLNGIDANRVVSCLARYFAIPVSAFASCAGVLDEGTEIALSAPGGRYDRVSIALRIPRMMRAHTVFMAGCFEGTKEELLRASNQEHGIGTPENLHYRSFISFAQEAFSPITKLPDIATAIRARIAVARPRP